MNDRDSWTLNAMTTYGGSFVKALVNLATHADPINLAKIKATWPEYWKDYEEKGKALEKQDARE